MTEAESDLARLKRILLLLDDSAEINDDTVEWLSRGIHPHFVEGYVLDVSFHEEARFWYFLHLNYREHAKLLFVAADAAFLANWPNALELFFQAFELAPSLVFGLDGDVWDAIQRSPFRLKYELILLKDAVAQNDQEFLNEILPELRAEFEGDTEALKVIEATISPTKTNSAHMGLEDSRTT